MNKTVIVGTIGHVSRDKGTLVAALMKAAEIENTREKRVLARVRAGELRIVHSQRKRKLRKKGIRVWWEDSIGAYVWEPDVYWHARGLYREPKHD